MVPFSLPCHTYQGSLLEPIWIPLVFSCTATLLPMESRVGLLQRTESQVYEGRGIQDDILNCNCSWYEAKTGLPARSGNVDH